MSGEIPKQQIEAAIQHARNHPRWKNYVDADIPAPPPSKAAENGGFTLGFVLGGFTAFHLLQKGHVLRSPNYQHHGWDFKPEGWALRPKLRINPTVFVVGLGVIGGVIGRSFAASVKRSRQREWERLGLVPKTNTH